jgi:hypothetical protein
MQGPTSVEKQRIFAIVRAIEDTIKECGQEGVPLGPLYAALMGVMSYHTFEAMINAMVQCKRIEVKYHVAKWIGDAK